MATPGARGVAASCQNSAAIIPTRATRRLVRQEFLRRLRRRRTRSRNAATPAASAPAARARAGWPWTSPDSCLGSLRSTLLPGLYSRDSAVTPNHSVHGPETAQLEAGPFACLAVGEPGVADGVLDELILVPERAEEQPGVACKSAAGREIPRPSWRMPSSEAVVVERKSPALLGLGNVRPPLSQKPCFAANPGNVICCPRPRACPLALLYSTRKFRGIFPCSS